MGAVAVWVRVEGLDRTLEAAIDDLALDVGNVACSAGNGFRGVAGEGRHHRLALRRAAAPVGDAGGRRPRRIG